MISFFDLTADNFGLFQKEILYIEKASFLAPWNVHSFVEELERPVSRFLAMEADNRLAGYLCFWIFAGEMHLMKMAVHPEMRGKGFGFFLLARMIEEGRSEGAEKVWLEVRLSNHVARGLYGKAGFMEVGRRKGYYSDEKEDAVVLALNM